MEVPTVFHRRPLESCGNPELLFGTHFIRDVVMPGKSGVALAEELRSRRPGLRVLYVSGYTDDQVVRRGLRDQAHGFLQKPYSLSTLAVAVRKVLDRDR